MTETAKVIPFRPSVRPRDVIFEYVLKKRFDIAVRREMYEDAGKLLPQESRDDDYALECMQTLILALEEKEMLKSEQKRKDERRNYRG